MYGGFAAGWIRLWIVFGHAKPIAIAVVAAVALAVHLFVVFYEEPTLTEEVRGGLRRVLRERAPLVAASARLG